MLDQLAMRPASLTREFSRLSPAELLEHFRSRTNPKFLPGFDDIDKTVVAHRAYFRLDTDKLIEKANLIVEAHRWPLLGFGDLDFGKEIDWHRDPISGTRWPLEYHATLALARGGGADVRVLWELNRLPQLLTLGRAYAITRDERYSEEVFAQLESWRLNNPVGRGANWACAMEVALRVINVMAALALVRSSAQLTPKRLGNILAMCDRHGGHIRRNLEFSYISTSNHYLSDVTGLLWLGVMFPELAAASSWREFGLRELLKEMDTQVLPDGADYEASTGYHRFVLELFLYSFIVCRSNGIAIPDRYWKKLRSMIAFVVGYLKPDGSAPLIGDSDSGQVMGLTQRSANDHGYLLAIASALLGECYVAVPKGNVPEEPLWIAGEEALGNYLQAATSNPPSSRAFDDAGLYILRSGNDYALLNASGNGLNGRGSHGHNDALSIEVSACGTNFIVDPGTFVYSSDLHERHLFRSTAYHSTVEVDGVEQNTTDGNTPFVIGDEAHPRVLTWESNEERDIVVAEHFGYRRLASAVTHRRTVEFNKRERYWLIEDELTGEGEHEFRFRFHIAHGLNCVIRADAGLEVCDKITGAWLLILPQEEWGSPALEPRWTSRDYGAKEPSQSVCWTLRASVPVKRRFVLLPVCRDEDMSERLGTISRLFGDSSGEAGGFATSPVR